MSRLSVSSSGALSGAQLIYLAKFVDQVQEAVDSTSKSVRANDPDRELVVNSMAAALLILAARIASRNFPCDGKAGLERAFLLSANEAIEIVVKERERGFPPVPH
jgi:hypothetical protein